MDKQTVEKVVAEKLGFAVPMTHKGNHRWESETLATDAANSGAFAAFFKDIKVTVNAPPCDPQAMRNPEAWSVFNIDIRWNHREGGSNGDTLYGFYYDGHDALPAPTWLDRSAANEKYWSLHR